MNGFSELHKIVYGVSSRPLDAEIDARPEDLDRPDNVGLTPLWYACWLGKSNHVRILMQYGANVNSICMPPRYAAVWSRSHDSIEQLLNASASIADSFICSPYEAFINLDAPGGKEQLEEVLAIDKALFGRFLGINGRSYSWQPSPLMELAMKCSPTSRARMRQLLELGADTEVADEEGLSALCHTIYGDGTEGCKILGRAGANSNVQTDRGHTVIRLAIKNAWDADLIQAVSELDLSGVELGAKDNWGCTAFELFEFRAGRFRDDTRLSPGYWSFYKSDFAWDDHDMHIVLPSSAKTIYWELQILLAFQNLLQQVQEAQGIPIEDRYPLLDLSYDCLMSHRNEVGSFKTVPCMPGAWPEN